MSLHAYKAFGWLPSSRFKCFIGSLWYKHLLRQVVSRVVYVQRRDDKKERSRREMQRRMHFIGEGFCAL